MYMSVEYIAKLRVRLQTSHELARQKLKQKNLIFGRTIMMGSSLSVCIRQWVLFGIWQKTAMRDYGQSFNLSDFTKSTMN